MGKKLKYLLVQPHSDDILLSCSHMLFSNKNCEILTIENNSKRVAEDEKLYEFLNIPYNHLNIDFDDQSFYGFYKQYKSMNLDNSKEYLTEFFGADKLNEIRDAVETFITNFINKSKEDIIMYIPWGVSHPFHLFIRNVIESKFDNNKIRCYRDFPHSYKRRAVQQVEEQLVDYELYDTYPIEEFADIKWGLAKKFYKTQSGLFWFEQGYIKKNLPEEVYERK